MRITVKFFSFAKLAGTKDRVFELPQESNLGELMRRLSEQVPQLFPAADTAIYLVNDRAGTRDTLLKDGDQIIMIKVMGGG